MLVGVPIPLGSAWRRTAVHPAEDRTANGAREQLDTPCADARHRADGDKYKPAARPREWGCRVSNKFNRKSSARVRHCAICNDEALEPDRVRILGVHRRAKRASSSEHRRERLCTPTSAGRRSSCRTPHADVGLLSDECPRVRRQSYLAADAPNPFKRPLMGR
jgi:hypothetical protein